MKIPSSITTLLAGIFLTLASLWYGQNHGLLPTAASDEAAQVDGLFNTMMTIATGLFLLVQGVIIVSAFRFRRRQDDTSDGPPVHGNVPLEILWTAIPAVIVLWISIYSFEVYNSMGGFDPMAAHDPRRVTAVQESQVKQASNMSGSAIAATLPGATKNLAEGQSDSSLPQPKDSYRRQVALGLGASPANKDKAADVVVNVMGLQYAWIFTYPQGITAGDLHIPVDREVQLNISAQDVLHAFWLPEFRLKQDAIPGRQTELRFTARKTGDYPVVCAELCGAYHSAMKTRIIVHTPEEYQSWLQSQQVATTAAPTQTVATKPADLPTSEFLAPYTEGMEIKSEALEQLRPVHHPAHHHTDLAEIQAVAAQLSPAT